MDIPKEGSGSVKLNMVGGDNAPQSNSGAAPTVSLADETKPADTPTVADAHTGSEGLTTIVEKVQDPNSPVPQIGIPAQGDEPVAVTQPLNNSDSASTTAEAPNLAALGNDDFDLPEVSSQSTVRNWGLVLVTSVVVLVGVFFYLASNTTLFQGQVALPEEESIVLPGSAPVDTPLDGSPEDTGTSTTAPITPPAEEGIVITGAEESEPAAPADENGFVLPPEFEAVINQNTSEGQPVSDGGPVVDGSDLPVDPTGDPQFGFVDPTINQQPDTELTEFIDPTANQATETPEPTLPAPTESNNGIAGTLNSNTNPMVLSSSQVQGNTGPGVLLYFLAPGMVMLRRLRR